MSNGLLSQEEIDALLKSTLEPETDELNLQAGNNAGEQDAVQRMPEDFAGDIAAKGPADLAQGRSEVADSVAPMGGQMPAPPIKPGKSVSHLPSASGPKAQIQPAHFSPLYPGQTVAQADNLDLILDVSLQVSIELGKTRKTIKEILDMGPGSIIELDRLAGEPVDMIINGKLIAKCEVVVINETFGVRVTDIVQPAERMKTLS